MGIPSNSRSSIWMIGFGQRISNRNEDSKRACECYGVIEHQLDDFAVFDTDATK
jgi:hypothetical protein